MPEPVAPAAPSAAPSSAAPSKPSVAAPVKPTSSAPGQQSAGAPSAQPEGTAPPPSRLTRKERIDGKEVELSATEEELWAAHRKGATVDRRFEEVARHRREVEAERARTSEMYARLQNPERFLEVFMEANPDADPVEVMATLLQKRLHEDEQNQDPNIRERRRLERENQAFKSEKQKLQEQQEFEQHEQQVDAAREELSGTFGEALAMTKLPKNDITIEFMAKAYFTNKQQGWNLSPQQLAAATEKTVGGMIESMLSNESTTDEQLLSAFPVLTKRIHKAIVGRFKSRATAPNTPGQQPSDITPRERRPSTEEASKQRVLSSVEEHKAFGGKGLRTI